MLEIKFFNPFVTFFFELECKFLVARFHDSAVVHHMDEIWHDIIQKSLIMSDYHEIEIGRASCRERV